MKLVKKQLLASLIIMFLISMTMVTIIPLVNVASATPDTYFSVDPPHIVGTPEGKFAVNVTITEANDTYAWSIYVGWDSDRLELINVKQGDFLHRWKWIPVPPPGGWVPKYATSFAYVPLDEANAEGQIIVGCTLIGDPATADWANGTGWLCTLEFVVQAEGSTLLNLFNTRLADYLDAEGYPAYTEYDNEDGLVDATNFYNVDVSKWEIKVNGEVGGKTTVGTENVLEAVANNTGNFNVYVKARFEVRNVTSLVASNESDIVPLPVGELTTLSVNWTANKVGVYNITAYAFYSAPPIVDTVTIPDGFTNGTVTVTVRDIAITNVTCSSTTVMIGDLVSINVTVANEGGFNETFDVSTYYDSIPIEEQTDINLDAGATTTLTFEWNTTLVGTGVYNISAKASEVPNEINTTNNLFVDGNITLMSPPEYPIANFTYSPEEPLVNGEVTFNATDSHDDDGYIVSYEWDFDDGTTKIYVGDNLTAIATHTYTEFGNYIVKLTVTDNSTLKAYRLNPITVYAPPVANFTYLPEDPMSNDTVTFNATDSNDPDGDIVSYAWDFGDGTPVVELPPPDGVIVTHSYADDGVYTVALNITDNDGLSNITSADITVFNRPPVANFTESAETVDTGVVIHFNASESYDPDGSIISYFWDFGDETNATGVTTAHAYADDGIYTVTLTVTDDDEATDTATSPKTVLNRPPVANFTESAETVDTGETITFNASDSYDPDGSIVSYFWDFGDETNATETDPITTHEYVDAGTYNVTLTVTDDDGATSSIIFTKTVKAPEGWSLVWYAVIGLGIAALTLIALYALYRRRKQ